MSYLYKEILKDMKSTSLIELKFVNKGNEKISKYMLYIFDSTLVENIEIYNKLFKNKWEYLSVGDFKRNSEDDKEYINILNIGNKCSVYALFEDNTPEEVIKYLACYIAIALSDNFVINKVIDIKSGFNALDIALTLGKDVYAIPGDIFYAKNYLANYAIKQGAIPICDISDIRYILLQKHYKRA